jgi:hypothetical protein
MTTNHMFVSMWTEIDETQSEKLSGGSAGSPPPAASPWFTIGTINNNEGSLTVFTQSFTYNLPRRRRGGDGQGA